MVSPTTFSVSRTIQLAYDTSADTESSGRGVPNYVSSFVISPDGTQAWVTAKKDDTARGPLRDGQPITSDNFVRAIVCVIDMNTEAELIAEREDIDNRALPVAVAFSPNGGYGYILAMASNWIGISDAYSVLNLSGINRVGSAPDSLALAPDGKLFVSSYLSREVIVYDLSLSLASIDHKAPEALARVRVVEREVLDAKVLLGKQVLLQRRRHAHEQRRLHELRVLPLRRHERRPGVGLHRCAARACATRSRCSDRAAIGQGRVHWSANFDEIQDFERDIREDFEGSGFMPDAEYQSRRQRTDATSRSPRPRPASARSSTRWRRSSRRWTRRRAARFAIPTAASRRRPWPAARCSCVPAAPTCHSGPDLTDSAGGALHDVGTLAPTSGKRLGETLVGIDTPSLKGVWQSAPYYHDGRAATLLEVLTTYNVGDRMGVDQQPDGDRARTAGGVLARARRRPGASRRPRSSLQAAAMATMVAVRWRAGPRAGRGRTLSPRCCAQRSPGSSSDDGVRAPRQPDKVSSAHDTHARGSGSSLIAPIAPAARSLCLLASLVFGCGKDRPQALPDTGAGDGGVTPAVDGAAIGACPDSGRGRARRGCSRGGAGRRWVRRPTARSWPQKAIDSDAQYPHRTEKLFCRGRGIDDAVRWQFLVTGGAECVQVVDAAGPEPLGVSWLRHVPLRF